MKTIGIVGGGQLGRMLTIEAKKMGFHVIVTDPTPQSPAGQVADEQILAGYKDEKGIRELAQKSDFITFEIELANDKVLEELIDQGKSVNPNPKTLRIIRDKLKQKEFLKTRKIPTAEFVEVKTKEDIVNAGKDFGFPFLLKARTDAYDGRGNALISSAKDIERGMKKLEARELYVERFVPFVKELAIMVARSTTGEIKTYPVVETHHKNNICDTVIIPAPVEKAVTVKAQALAEKVMQELQGAGVFGIEMFLTKEDELFVNEIAPRVHNSGHYTIEACVTSQFEQHIRAITGMTLGDTSLKVPASVMINILGERDGEAQVEGMEEALSLPGVSVHMYGKKETRVERKMGHITVIGDTIAEAIQRAQKARKYITI